MSEERSLIVVRLELIGEDYELTDYIKGRIEKLGHKYMKELSPIELLDLYDSILCKIYQ
jgi:hypothetical protein